ncbi:MAG: Gfo/Idh/MocA family oxidoreductase [Actinomycetota bacterium]|nr:Gfo/Idh/MocA family oxidoreductase [Actinomycetota bacterium]
MTLVGKGIDDTAPVTRLVIVGLGRQGARHARVARNDPNVELVGTVDPFAPGTPDCPHFDKLSDALDCVSVDAAVVATATTDHGTVARELLDLGIPTLVEKPLAIHCEEAAALVDLARTRGTLLAVGYVERFNPAVSMVAAMLRRGVLGSPIDITFQRLGLPPAQAPDVDVIHDLAVHDIDVFSMLAQAPSAQAPSARTPMRLVAANGWPARGLAESAHLLLQCGEVTGAIQVNWRTPVRLRGFSVTTDRCYVEANYTTQRVEVVQPSEPSDLLEFSEFQSHYGSAKRVQLELRQAEPLAEEQKAFIALVSGRETSRLATGGDGLESLRIADEATEILSRG